MADEKTVTDSRGRKIAYRELAPADMMDLMEAADDVSGNAGWMAFALGVASVTSIDGVPVPVAENKADVKRNANTLGNDGIVAVQNAIFGSPKKATKKAAGTAKNSSGHPASETPNS
jgi:hypothetical protein